MVCDFVCVCEISTVVVYFEKGQKKMERKRGRKCQDRCGKECCVVRIIHGRIALH